MDIFDKVILGFVVVGGVTANLFFWVLGYVMLIQAGVL